MKLNPHFMNTLINIDRQQTIHSTQTSQQHSLSTLINMALDRRHGTYSAGITTHPQVVTP